MKRRKREKRARNKKTKAAIVPDPDVIAAKRIARLMGRPIPAIVKRAKPANAGGRLPPETPIGRKIAEIMKATGVVP